MDFREFFRTATEQEPYPYQARLAEGAWPDLIDVPTGLGKTGAVALAWLYRRYRGDETAPTRLVWCLPMRVLVEQTRDAIAHWLSRLAPTFEQRGRKLPSAELMMGGDQQTQWAMSPEHPAIVVGTQDMLLSRALMRGYGMSRYAWPMHFAWLHNDALWIFDETQLMGVGVETSAQLDAFRALLGTARPSRSIWMSATLGQRQIETVDHPRPLHGWGVLSLDDADRALPAVRTRVDARKAIGVSPIGLDKNGGKEVDKKGGKSEYATGLAARILQKHQAGALTLVIVNRVSRAQAIYQALRETAPAQKAALLHSRFRPGDRGKHYEMLVGEGDRIVVSTQVVEAGVDVSARTLFTELAPWSSLVQRFGRCNRYGEFSDASVEWIDLQVADEKDETALPYAMDDLIAARSLLAGLSDVGPTSLTVVSYTPPSVIRPVIRRKDLVELFDTTPDLAGNDLDVSRYVRDETNDSDVSVFWRTIDEAPGDATAAPDRDELCAVTLTAFRAFAKKKDVLAFSFDPLADEHVWVPNSAPRAGQTVLVSAASGGYDLELGFTGVPAKKGSAVPEVEVSTGPPEAMRGDPESVARWLSLFEHVKDVVDDTRAVADALRVDKEWSRRLDVAANWHDVGKAHEAFQHMMTAPGKDDERYRPPDLETLWAKSNHTIGKPSRKYFRHELASALAFLQHYDGDDGDAIAYLIAAHHGKVRLSIRSLPGEDEPTAVESDGLFARGVWHGDTLPALQLPDGTKVPETKLDLRVMRLGRGSWLERTLGLRDDASIGPFRLAWFESILRLGDQRASARERQGGHP